MKNEYKICGDITIIYLTKKNKETLECLIDTEDLSKIQLSSKSWSYIQKNRCIYAFTRIKIDNKYHIKYMHRFILSPDRDKQVDHINFNGLDNRKSNLRICTDAENKQNKRTQLNNKSGINGVWWDKSRSKFQAYIYLNYKRIYLGRFKDIQEAKSVVEKAKIRFMPFSQEAMAC